MAAQSDIEPERNSIHTIVAVKRDRNWYFTAFQNSYILDLLWSGIIQKNTKISSLEIVNNFANSYPRYCLTSIFFFYNLIRSISLLVSLLLAVPLAYSKKKK
jgi:hypothetical protein